MKVIGKEVKVYRAVCPYCSIIIEFKKEDIKKGLVPFLNKLQCPICKKIAYVGNPEKFLKRVDTKEWDAGQSNI